jgi:alanyl-tRNA synthetase
MDPAGKMLADINNRFVRFYQEQGFQRLNRASLLDPTIPMSFVMSAGLVQVEKALASFPQRTGNKYVLVQDCFRHFDVEKVGQDNIHLSFFNMPGAFAFGDISAETIVQTMWRLATTILGLNPENLWASYFAGGKVFGREMAADTATHQAWQSTGLPASRIVGLSKEHNFWIQGNGFQGENLVRKCGPNTELFYDRGSQRACGPGCAPGCNCGRFVEFSNSLFIRFEIEPQNECLRPIQSPFTETVIGSERICMLLENQTSVFDTSIYQPIIQTMRQFIPASFSDTDTLHAGEHVIADHLRALCGLVSDGAPPPGKDGRQRIIKILIRRIVTYQLILGIEADEFLPAMLACVFNIFPGSENQPGASERLLSYYASEKERYMKTLARGFLQINRLIHENGAQGLDAVQMDKLRQYWGIPEILATSYAKREMSMLRNSVANYGQAG